MKRFRKVANPATDKWDIIDEKASKKINGLVVYNDLGSLYFSSAPQICDLLNDLNEENQEYRKENEQLRQTMYEVCEFLAAAVDLFSDATYYMIPVTKEAIKLLKGDD